jgi:hypothetical protein
MEGNRGLQSSAERVRFLGWPGVEHPWGTEGSSTVCSEEPDCSDSDDSLRQAILSGVTAKNQTAAREGSDGTKRGQDVNGIKVAITTSKGRTTATTLEASANARLENGVEIDEDCCAWRCCDDGYNDCVNSSGS